jgi:hypothetical protein
MPSPSFHVSSLGNKLVTCGNFNTYQGPNGTAKIFKLNPLDLGSQGKGVEAINTCVFNISNLNDLPISPPDKLNRTVRLTEAYFEPIATEKGSDTAVKRIAAIQASSLHYYDITSAKVIGTQTVRHNLTL